ncbi:MAG: hypothetical protein F6K09_20770 [Merismopedia sp. SIO2A8]|nr:hypothetical protein [Merismopedia sp. SIO2A8]
MTESDNQVPELIMVEGVIKRSQIGVGTWTLVGMGRTMEIFRAKPQEILQEGLRVRVTGRIRTDVMTAAMVGPVFEIESFQILK